MPKLPATRFFWVVEEGQIDLEGGENLLRISDIHGYSIQIKPDLHGFAVGETDVTSRKHETRQLFPYTQPENEPTEPTRMEVQL